MSEKLINYMWGTHRRGWCELPAVGNTGGLAVVWDLDRIKVTDSFIGDLTISLRCKNLGMSEFWTFTAVYRPVIRANKVSF